MHTLACANNQSLERPERGLGWRAWHGGTGLGVKWEGLLTHEVLAASQLEFNHGVWDSQTLPARAEQSVPCDFRSLLSQLRLIPSTGVV